MEIIDNTYECPLQFLQPKHRLDQGPVSRTVGGTQGKKSVVSKSASRGGRGESHSLTVPPAVLANLAKAPDPVFYQHVLELLRRQIPDGHLFRIGVDSSGSVAGDREVYDTVDTAAGPALTETLRSAIRGRAIEIAEEIVAAETPLTVERRVRVGPRTSEIVGQPVLRSGRVVAIFVCVGFGQRVARESMGQAVELLAALEHFVVERREGSQNRDRFSNVAAFVELLSTVESGADFPECSLRLGNHLRDILGCDVVALAAPTRFGQMKISAVSGSSDDVSLVSEAREALLALAVEVSAGEEVREYFGSKESGSGLAGTGNSGAMAEIVKLLAPAFVMAAPLIDKQGERQGAWIFLWNDVPEGIGEKRLLLQACGPEVAAMQGVLKAARPGPFRGALVRFWRKATSNQKRFFKVLAGLVGGVLCLPVPYPVKAPVVTEPVVRRVVAAPFDGTLESSQVAAGEMVVRGDLLAQLDGREIRSQLAEAHARRERAYRQADLHRSAGRIAEARIAELEAESLSHEIVLLHYQQDHLEIRAPIDGLVLKGDLERSEGAPLKMGDPLFEVGPLDRLLFEVAVDAKEVSLVELGDKVKFTLRAQVGGGSLSGKVSRILPRSESRDGRNVFVCEAEIKNEGGDLRPGLEGKATISGPWRPIVWIWLRDAWMAARYYL